MGVFDFLKAGVVYGKDLEKLYAYAKENEFAIPAVNVVGTNSINAALSAAKEANSPIIIQFSNGGAAFFSGKTLNNPVLGAIAGAKYIHEVAKEYGVAVVIHTDHAAKKLLPWIDELIKANKEFYDLHKKPLFSSHMLDLSEESLEENIELSCEYFKKFNELEIGIEIELGCTGGEEDGVDNTNIDNAKLYTQPIDVAKAHERLAKIGSNYTIAASFGNVHGVYKPGNVRLEPIILKNCQEFLAKGKKTLNFVFHGGSGSEAEKIKEAISYGVIKMNIDTDTQWAFWDGVRNYESKNHGYLQGQIGNPEGDDKPNKKYYDPRVWLNAGEKTMQARLMQAFKELNCLNRN
ncbi:class II fructose-bisphosphate aldolase [Campylobacter canadensis]|uniref:class II fructose-bisphosphate aldolase n=1 Tax=Campylobacter canadensis TaxID=449520 RepID=UPI001553900B|nr:class II fructose-bisphosphate aldolase [Campylobacter canadensis]MBZ7995263.1 class II fructose-bisphosphate aldolase [Campylobacter canadensis]MBZ7996772.1 class II fructose-bisphosphate aldolase [Campylobacter canadensis]MBZ7998624.1 class II fructose-bisphosphate aldolase [Campylobacter canadensis]MBZ8000647.1 class II fructose-bisphosphate aldolase [Campylobacter canadensis]MBZ8001994.1 class II fructose-bisphosphate aldolase [Campylobacter canadensis]